MKELIVKNVKIEWLGHSGFRLTMLSRKEVIYIDPFGIDEEKPPKAGLILITHSHYDHFSEKDIKKISLPNTRIFAPPDVAMNMKMTVEPGLFYSLDHIKVETFPAYNLDKPYHPKENKWVSYLITFDGSTRLFHTGDSDLIVDFKDLFDVDVLLVPVSGKFVMTSEEAFSLAKAIKPGISIPMHYGKIVGDKEDAEKFKSLCEKEGLKAEILEKA